jgi:hypothetical protein
LASEAFDALCAAELSYSHSDGRVEEAVARGDQAVPRRKLQAAMLQSELTRRMILSSSPPLHHLT